MTNLKDLLDKVKSEHQEEEIKPVSEMYDEEYGESDYEEGPVCYYLNEDGTCSDGCSCAEVEIEQQCPYFASGDCESCCCYEEAYYDEEESGESEEDEEESEYEDED